MILLAHGAAPAAPSVRLVAPEKWTGATTMTRRTIEVGDPVDAPPVFDPAREDWTSFVGPGRHPGLTVGVGQDTATNPILSLLPHGQIVGRPFGSTGVDAPESPVLEFPHWTRDVTRGLWAPEFSAESNLPAARFAPPGFQPLVEAGTLSSQAADQPDSFSGNLLVLLGGLASGVVAASVIWFVPKGRSPGS